MISVHSCTLIWVSNLKFKSWKDSNLHHQMTLMSLLNDGIIMRNVPANRCPKGADNGWSLKLLSTPTKVITSTWIIFSCTNSISLVKSSSNESLHSGEFSLQLNQIYLNKILYARHYNPRFAFFTPFFASVYIVEQLVLQMIYVLNMENLQFFGIKSAV